MTNMDQGISTTTCFYCALLYPEHENKNCPRCQSQPRFLPAQMMDEDSAAARTEGVARRWLTQRGDPSALLELIHLHGPAGLKGLTGAGVTLDELRALIPNRRSP